MWTPKIVDVIDYAYKLVSLYRFTASVMKQNWPILRLDFVN